MAKLKNVYVDVEGSIIELSGIPQDKDLNKVVAQMLGTTDYQIIKVVDGDEDGDDI